VPPIRRAPFFTTNSRKLGEPLSSRLNPEIENAKTTKEADATGTKAEIDEGGGITTALSAKVFLGMTLGIAMVMLVVELLRQRRQASMTEEEREAERARREEVEKEDERKRREFGAKALFALVVFPVLVGFAVEAIPRRSMSEKETRSSKSKTTKGIEATRIEAQARKEEVDEEERKRRRKARVEWRERNRRVRNRWIWE